MFTPETSRLFTRWTHEATNVDSYILTERPASVQKHFYYTNRGFTDDGRFCWFDSMFVPHGGKDAEPVLGLIDFERDELRVYHETQHSCAPYIDLQTGDAYFARGMELWKRGPHAGDRAERVNTVTDDILAGRKVDRLGTHFTRSADGTFVNFDIRYNEGSLIGDIPLDGSAPRLWADVRGFHNHAQLSPTDNDLQLVAHDFWKDHDAKPFDGQHLYHRMWLVRRDGHVEPVIPDYVDIGLDILNPIQPTTMDDRRLKREFGDKLSSWGGINVQSTIPFGSPADVVAEVRDKLDVYGRGGGFIISSSHNVQPNPRSIDNTMTFYWACRRYGEYRDGKLADV